MTSTRSGFFPFLRKLTGSKLQVRSTEIERKFLKAVTDNKTSILIGWILSKSSALALQVNSSKWVQGLTTVHFERFLTVHFHTRPSIFTLTLIQFHISGTFGVIGSCVMFVILGSNKNTVGSVLMRNFAFSNMLFSLSLPVWLIESYNRKVQLYISSIYYPGACKG